MRGKIIFFQLFCYLTLHVGNIYILPFGHNCTRITAEAFYFFVSSNVPSTLTGDSGMSVSV